MNTRTTAIAAFAALLLPLAVFASDIRMGSKPVVGTDEKIISNLYLVGGNVSSSGTVLGDAVLGGGDIVMNGPVSQDILAAGGNITILGSVGGDLRVAGGNIVVSGPVKGDVVAGGGQTTLSGSSIGGDVIWAGGELHIDAPVSGNLQLRGGDVIINAPIQGSVTFKGGSIHLGPKAMIAGNLAYTTPDKVSMEEGAVVKGRVDYAPAPEKPNKGIIAAIASLAFLAKFLMTLACAMTLGLIFNTYSRNIVRGASEQPLIELGRGFVTMVMLPIASIILIATLIGLPFGILGLLSFAALLVFSWIITPILVGSFVYKWIAKTEGFDVNWKTILLGVVIYLLVGFIPVIGWVFKFVAALIALGAAVRIKWEVAKEWR